MLSNVLLNLPAQVRYSVIDTGRAIQEANCYHEKGHDAACNFAYTHYMLIFGIIQIFMSQIPNMHETKWVSAVAAVMSVTYSFITLGLGVAHVVGIENTKITLTTVLCCLEFD